MQLDTLLVRADDERLQSLVGQPALRLMHLLDSTLATPAKLREIALGLCGQQGLLADKDKRCHLLDLLKPNEAEELALLLDVSPNGNAYEALKDANIRRGSNREEFLFNYFLLDPPERAAPNEEPSLKRGDVSYRLFKHQRRAARAVKEYLEHPPRRVVLHMPTGAGKTRVTMHIIAEHLRQQEPGVVIWLAYGKELCEQAASEFERAWQHLGNRPVNVHRFWGARSLALEDIRDGILVTSLPKMYNAARREIYFIGQLGSRCTLAIIDEAHQAVAETYRLVLDALVVHNEDTGLLGLTATPGCTWADISADEELADFFARQKVSLDVPGYENPVRYLMDEGYLAQTHFEPLFAESDIELSGRDLDRIKNNLNVPDDVLRRLAVDDKRNLSIATRLEDLLARHRRVLLFATTVAHAELMATVLQACGHRAASITAETSPAARNRRIRRFKSKDAEAMVLCNYGVLTTGFDAPQTSAALIARPTKSLVLYSQMVGRAIRGPKAGGNEEAEIVTVIDRALPGFGSVADAFLNWEDVWN